MMRTIISHKDNGLNDKLEILVVDPPGDGGASNHYVIDGGVDGDGRGGAVSIDFQEGPIAEAGVNGISNEALLAIVADRLNGFQSGPCACEINGFALGHIREALSLLLRRTSDRIARGVEGTSAQ